MRDYKVKIDRKLYIHKNEFLELEKYIKNYFGLPDNFNLEQFELGYTRSDKDETYGVCSFHGETVFQIKGE